MTALDFEKLTFTDDYVPVKDLHIDTTYQRPLSPAKVQVIVESFSMDLVGLLFVSRRTDGTLWVCDGQHRLGAIATRHEDYAPCRVFTGLTIAQEARIFTITNTARKNPDANSIFKARLASGDAEAVRLKELVEQCGFTVQTTNGGTRVDANSIWAVNALYDIMRQGGEELLVYVLTLIRECWPDEPEAVRAEVLLGIKTFHNDYKQKYTRQEFIYKLKGQDLRILKKQAIYHHKEGGVGLQRGWERALQQAYDFHKKGSSRLLPRPE